MGLIQVGGICINVEVNEFYKITLQNENDQSKYLQWISLVYAILISHH